MPFTTVLWLALVVLIVAAGSPAAAQSTTLRLAYVAPPPVWGPIADRYARAVAEQTGEAVKIHAVGGGQLGNLAQNYAGLRTGQIDMMLADTGALGLARGGRDFNVLFAPYAFRDRVHLRAVMRSPMFASMLARVEAEGGFKFLGYVSDREPRQLSTTRTRVMKPDDLKGLKIRVPEAPTTLATFRAWGASPTPLPASELYLGLKQGLVDGQDNGFDGIAQAKLYEVQKFVARLDYVQSGLMVLISADRWRRLSPAHQGALLGAVAETEPWASGLTHETALRSLEVLRRHGVEITEPDLTPFRTIALEAMAKLDGELWSPGLLGRLQAIR